MKDWLQKVEEAKQELSAKTLDQIQQETAIKWAARYAAAYELSNDNTLTTEVYDQWVHDQYEYRSEALEHAAQVQDEMFYATIRMLIG